MACHFRIQLAVPVVLAGFGVGCGADQGVADTLESDTLLTETVVEETVTADIGTDDVPALDTLSSDAATFDTPPAEVPPAPACAPYQVQDCYTGPPATLGVGACRRGARICLPDGSDWTECLNEVLPQTETCGDPDLDCDGVLPPACAPEVVATGSSPLFLATSPEDPYIYWTTRHTGEVHRARKDGTAEERLFTGESDPRGLLVEDDHVVWTSSSGLRRGRKDGTEVHFVYQLPAYSTEAFRALLGQSCTTPFLLAVTRDDGGYFVSTYSPGCTGILRITDAGDATGLPTRIDTSAIILDGDTLFMGTPLTRMAVDGSSITTLRTGTRTEGIAVDEHTVFVQGQDMVYRIDKAGHSYRTLASFELCGGSHWAVNVAVSERRVYWLEQCSQTLRAIDKDGQNEEILHRASGTLFALLHDGEHLYWSEPSPEPRVMKLRVGR
jgi:hypothetical protein